jgi:hypothetical protein
MRSTAAGQPQPAAEPAEVIEALRDVRDLLAGKENPAWKQFADEVDDILRRFAGEAQAL